MHTITLNNKKTIPTIGLGTWNAEKTKVGEAVAYAITQCGYRHIDCASIYGNEKEIGRAFCEVFSSNKIKREDIFITSKLWNTDHHPSRVEEACRKTITDLQLEYLDLYLVHWGMSFKPGDDLEPIGKDGYVKTEAVSIRETWEAMEALVKKGLVASIGVSNFTAPIILDLLTYAKIRPVMNQIEIHPFNTQEALVDYCHHEHIAVIAYSPLGNYNPHTTNKEKPNLFSHPTILELARSYAKTPSSILLRWSIQRGLIAIPKSTHKDHIRENIQVFDFELSECDMHTISALNMNHRFVDPATWYKIPYFS